MLVVVVKIVIGIVLEGCGIRRDFFGFGIIKDDVI